GRRGRRGRGVADALRGVVRGAGPVLPRLGHPAERAGQGGRGGGCRAAVAPVRRRRGRGGRHRALRRIGRLADAVPRVRHHRRGGGKRRQEVAREGQAAQRMRRVTDTMTSPTRLAGLSAAGVSVWLDDLSREHIRSGKLARLIAEYHVVGVTTNPTIFANALANGQAYDEQVRELAKRGADLEQAVR